MLKRSLVILHNSLVSSLKLIGLFLLFINISCDLEGRKNCAWVLEPEPSLKDKAVSGFIPVCARNRQTKKQDCRLQATLDFAKKAYGKQFRYVDIEVESVALPRTIKNIKFCDKN